jgi:zinc transport system permease protein
MLNKLVEYLEFPFVRYALVVGVLIALCSSLLGVTLVLKRFSFIGDGLSHVAFGCTAVAGALSLVGSFRYFFVITATIISAILLLRAGQNAKIKGDAALAMISVSTLGIGYLIMNVYSRSANLAGDVCSTLFGSTSILTLSKTDVWLCGVLSALVILLFLLFYNKFFSVTFDEDFSTATGTKAKTYNLILAVIIAIVIVVAMNLVGALLISALVIFPALSAMRVFKSFKAVTVCAVCVSVVCAFSGILVSILMGTPVGATIVAVDVTVFALFSGIGLIRRT